MKIWHVKTMMVVNIIAALIFLAFALILLRELQATGSALVKKAIQEATELGQFRDLPQDEVVRVIHSVARASDGQLKSFHRISIAFAGTLLGNALGWAMLARQMGALRRMRTSEGAGKKTLPGSDLKS